MGLARTNWRALRTILKLGGLIEVRFSEHVTFRARGVGTGIEIGNHEDDIARASPHDESW
jgi:hypothetical protein